MRTLPGNMASDLMGSSANAILVANVWYAGQLAFQNVPLRQFTMNWDDTRAIMGQSKIEIVDVDGLMVPWGYDDPTNVGGGVIQVKFILNNASVDLIYQPITRCEPTEHWSLRTVNGVKTWVPGGHIIYVETDDKLIVAQNNQFLVPETPPTAATCFSEINRIMVGSMDVVIDSNLTDRSVPSTVVYKGDRVTTLGQLCDALNAAYRTTGTGQLYVYKRPTVSQYTYKGDTHDAQLSGVDKIAKRKHQKQGLYNGVVSTNTLQGGQLLQGVALETSGPLAWGGPHGKVPYFHNANFATDQSSINADAQTQLATLIAARAGILEFSCRFDPAMETGDYITLMLPQIDGSEYPLPVTVSMVNMHGTSGLDAEMEVRATVAYPDMIAAAITNRKKAAFL